MRVLLLGANGQVGRETRQRLRALPGLACATRDGRLDDGTPCEVADLSAPGTLAALVDRVGADVVVNAAAYTAVDRAEDEAEAAYVANAEAPRALAEACRRRGALLVHYSTDYVFDGTGDRPYREDDATCPLGVYGSSKLAGEEAIRASGGRHMILRTAWVYATHGNNFMRTMLRLAGDRPELRVVADQFGTPTPASLIADVTAIALDAPPQDSGVWHLTAGGCCSWFEFAGAILARAHAVGVLERVPTLVPITTAEYPTAARRPAYSCLDTARLRAAFGVELPEWNEALAGVLAAPAG